MVKSLVAAGSVDSHEMGVVFNAEDVNKFKKPLLLQEYVNHNAAIEKVLISLSLMWRYNIGVRYWSKNVGDKEEISPKFWKFCKPKAYHLQQSGNCIGCT